MISITRQFQVALLIGLAAGIAIGVAVTAIAGAQGTTETADVRITARLLENGKVEFGLQQQEGGGWGEIILPRVNKFPYARATVDRWLYSSPVAVTATTAPSSLRAAATGAWRRSTVAAGDEIGIRYTLAGAGGSAPDVAHGGADRSFLEVTCWPGGVGSVGFFTEAYFDWNEWDGLLLATDSAGEALRSWTTSHGRLGHLYLFGSAFTFLPWLADHYTRSPSLTLRAWGREVVLQPAQFWATFDLTGLPAVLADLPCYEPVE